MTIMTIMTRATSVRWLFSPLGHCRLLSTYNAPRISESWIPPNPPTSVFTVTKENGFLPLENPMATLPRQYDALSQLLSDMPLKKPDGSSGLLDAGELGKAVQERLPFYDLARVNNKALQMALFRDLTFLSSAYLLEPADMTRRLTGKLGIGRATLPRNLAVPLNVISTKIGARPYMEYAQSYALYNYKKRQEGRQETFSTAPLKFDKLDLVRSFSGSQSERGFILTHVTMVSHTPTLVAGICDLLGQHFPPLSCDESSHSKSRVQALRKILYASQHINAEMDQMWKRSQPKDYASFRTFIMGTKSQKDIFPTGVVYEGVSADGRYYRGESGANDSIVPTLDNLLLLTDRMPQNPMTDILKDFRTYRPVNHTQWLSWVHERARNVASSIFRTNADTFYLYVLLLDQVREFRWRHWDFAKQYIIRHSNYPVATGGSPMSTWLPNQLLVVLEELTKAAAHYQTVYSGPTENHHLVTKLKERSEGQLETLRSEVKDFGLKYKR